MYPHLASLLHSLDVEKGRGVAKGCTQTAYIYIYICICVCIHMYPHLASLLRPLDFDKGHGVAAEWCLRMHIA